MKEMKSFGAFVLSRRATLRNHDSSRDTRQLHEWRHLDAYVLLGEPGLGKSWALEQEHAADPTGTILVSARDLATLGLPPGAESKTLLIDALDEHRASSDSFSSPLDAIRARLNELGRPRFRLTCREADWIDSDTTHLRAVAPSGMVHELRLEPLNEREVVQLLENAHDVAVADPQVFLEEARSRNLEPLLSNPLLLELLVKAVAGNQWPTTRQQTYLMACRRLAAENNPEHRAAARRRSRNVDGMLHVAGMLCALLLLSDKHAISADAGHERDSAIPVDAIPDALRIDSATTWNALSTTLFVSEGADRIPRHRTIAEFLAAQALSKCVAGGLPISRILALMVGHDGRIVEPLRGLYAWLATCIERDRGLLIDRDPLGLVLYGDVHPFTVAEKRRVFDALYVEGTRFRWFRNENWESRPFGALGTADMESTIRELITAPGREPADEVRLDCVLDAVLYGEDMPNLAQALEEVVRDASHWGIVRKPALQALLKAGMYSEDRVRRLLTDLTSGKASDDDDELVGILLTALYPSRLTEDEIFSFLHPRKAENLIGHYHMFWAEKLLRSTSVERLPYLMDRLASFLETASDKLRRYAIDSVAGRVLPLALRTAGTIVAPDRLYRWLHSVVNRYGMSEIRGTEAGEIANWLELHPQVQKSLYAHAVMVMSASVVDSREYWDCEGLLYRSGRPDDWYKWMLGLADTLQDELFARHCIERAGHALCHEPSRYSLSLDELAAWVESHTGRWPELDGVLQRTWTSELNGWQQENALRQREEAAQRRDARLRRAKDFAPHLTAMREGSAAPGSMESVANAVDKYYRDIEGETAAERVQDLLGTDLDTAKNVLSGLVRCLERTDLPTSDKVFELAREKKRFRLQLPCLIGAELQAQEKPEACMAWREPLVETMTAFVQVSYRETPDWFSNVAKARPEAVARAIYPYALAQIVAGNSHISSLSFVLSDPQLTEIARLLLPQLLVAIPTQASEGQLSLLQHTLLPAAFQVFELTALEQFIRDRLSVSSLDPKQRITWLVARMYFETTELLDELRPLVFGSVENTIVLAEALEVLRRLPSSKFPLEPSVIGELVQWMALYVTPERDLDDRIVSNLERLRDLTRGMIQELAARPDILAGEELRQLKQVKQLEPWSVELDAALFDHEKVARADAFRFVDTEAVARVLLNSSPANAEDLVALVVDKIALLAEHIRYDDSNGIRLFWRPKGQKGVTPKIENDCRDILHMLLRERMIPFGVQVEKEIHAANDKRCDLHASAIVNGKRIAIPIEIKRENHPEVWTAWKDQLIERYSTNPAASGHGIYLVLWFGVRPTIAPNGEKAKSPEEMASLYCHYIPREYHHRMSGLVLDLSRA